MVIFISGLSIFSKAATGSYLITYLHSIGFEDWLSALSIFIIRSVSIFIAGRLKERSFNTSEAQHVVGLLGLISCIGFLLILQINSYAMAVIVCILLASTTVSQMMTASIIIDEINKITDKNGFPFVFSGFDLYKMAINFTFSGILFLIIYIFGLNAGIYSMAFIGLFIFVTNYSVSLGLRFTGTSLSKIGSDPQVAIMGGMKYLIPISINMMIINAWISIVPTVMILSKFKLSPAWVSAQVLIVAFGFAMAFIFPILANRVGIRNVFLGLAVNMFLGSILMFYGGVFNFFTGCFLASVSIGAFFTVNNVYINKCPGETHQKISAYFHKVNFFQPYIYILVPIVIAFNEQGVLLIATSISLLISAIVFYVYDDVDGI